MAKKPIDLRNDITVKRRFEDGSFCLFILFIIVDSIL